MNTFEVCRALSTTGQLNGVFKIPKTKTFAQKIFYDRFSHLMSCENNM